VPNGGVNLTGFHLRGTLLTYSFKTLTGIQVPFLKILLLAIISSSACASEKTASLVGSPWVSSCSPTGEPAQKNCSLERAIYMNNEGKTQILTLSIEILKNEQGAILRFLTPLGVLLPLGLGFEISDQKSSKAPYIYCDTKGCYSQIILGQELLQSLLLSKSLTISYNHIKNNNDLVRFSIELGDLKIKLSDMATQIGR